jgi:CheY-like chemotaxis protein
MRPGTTLVVDDEPMVRQLVRRVLEPEVCEVVDAEDGESALRLIQHRRDAIDVVLTDLVMPGIDGFDVVDVLADHHPDLPVVCMSGYANQLDGRRLAAPVIPKPFTAEDLRAAIAPLIERSRALKGAAREHLRCAADRIATSKAVSARSEASLAGSVDLVAAALACKARRAKPPRPD